MNPEDAALVRQRDEELLYWCRVERDLVCFSLFTAAVAAVIALMVYGT